MRRLLLLVTLMLAGLVLAQGSDTDTTILQALNEDGDFTTLVGLIDQAGLSDQLSGTGPFTLFAPSDSVFEGLDQATLQQISSDSALLEQILLSHVVEGAYSVNSLQDAEEGSILTLQGEPLSIETTAGGLRVNGTGLTSTNVDNEYANGVIQGVNYLVIPSSLQAQYGPDSVLAQGEAEMQAAEEAAATEAANETAGEAATTDAENQAVVSETTILDLLQGDGRFSTLLGAIEQTGLAETLTSPGPVTLFAPTDAAFEALPPEQLEAILGDSATLERLLLYHVVDGDMMAADMTEGPILTFEGTEINVATADSGLTFNEASLEGEDLVASNGVVHAVNQVLLPADLTQ